MHFKKISAQCFSSYLIKDVKKKLKKIILILSNTIIKEYQCSLNIDNFYNIISELILYP